MSKNRVVAIFRTLDTGEVRQLAKFVRSPVYNQHEQVIELFEYLKNTNLEKSENTAPTAMFSHLFGNMSYDAQKLHYINSYLLKTIEAFLAWREWQEEENSETLYLLRAYRKKRIDGQFERTLKKFKRKRDKARQRNIHFHNNSYQMYIEVVRSESARRSGGLPLQALSDAQDISYIVEKLYNACTMLTHQAVVKKEYDTGLLDNVLEFLKDSPWLQIPAVAIYYHSYLALANVAQETHFQKMKTLLEAHQKAFSTAELKDLYLIAVNYCIRKINRNEPEYMKEVFGLYKSGLQAGVYLENDRMSRWTYRNIVVAGVKMKEFAWVKKFIHDYLDKLPSNHRNGSLNLNLAYYYFEKKDYDQAMPLLLQMEHDDVLHNLFGKAMLAKMYYELTEYNSLDNLLQSLRTYIRRKKGLGYHKNNYLNFTRYLQKLMNLNFYDKGAIADFRQNIQREQSLAEKEWLLERVSKE